MSIHNLVQNQPRDSQTNGIRHHTRLLTVGEVARMLHVHANSVRRWADEGLLPAYRIGRRGDRRFSEEAVENFLKRLA
jgi:excisionase family DNA binding protein